MRGWFGRVILYYWKWRYRTVNEETKAKYLLVAAAALGILAAALSSRFPAIAFDLGAQFPF